MKSLRIVHLTRYSYSESVVLNPHSIFLCPLQKSHYTLSNYKIEITPKPMDMELRHNIDNNPYYLSWFEGETEKLEIKVDFSVQLKAFNPFAFILDHKFTEDFQKNKDSFYSEEDKQLLHAALHFSAEPEITAFAKSFSTDQDDPLIFLNGMLQSIHEEWEHTFREDFGLWTPEKTLAAKSGSCRDLSWMLIQMLRSIGLACKFVSGYAFNPELEEGHELHAWVEVFLPGAGWVGIDPSLGLFADEHYLPLASSAIPRLTLPVVGTYGGAAESKLESEVYITPH
ncbi:transglutaminase family protein [Litoribacter populi]|uniref:transglutaminase family protein n=1 Tax=Litoribacter populi TaxID=2598460 RepID=UPI001180506B|nr:transglutaminase family protein [Litoribacter populi]